MKKLLSFLFSAAFTTCFAQLSHEPEAGIDSIARAHGIRKLVENSWWIGTTEFRNTLDRTKLFDSLGYLVEVDDACAFNIGFTKYPGKISSKTRLYYDKDGNFVKEDVEGNPLPAEVKDTVTKLVSRKWQTINNRKVPKQEVFSTKSDYENKEIIYTYHYFPNDFPDGREEKISCTVSDLLKDAATIVQTDFYYDSDGLLIRVIETTNGKTTGETTFEYTYFDRSAE